MKRRDNILDMVKALVILGFSFQALLIILKAVILIDDYNAGITNPLSIFSSVYLFIFFLIPVFAYLNTQDFKLPKLSESRNLNALSYIFVIFVYIQFRGLGVYVFNTLTEIMTSSTVLSKTVIDILITSFDVLYWIVFGYLVKKEQELIKKAFLPVFYLLELAIVFALSTLF